MGQSFPGHGKGRAQPLDQPAERAIPRGRVLFELPRRILGTVPVEPNGSVAFRAPAGVPMQLQLIDENAMAVMTMRSFVPASACF